MRIVTIASLFLGLLFQVGCALAPNFTIQKMTRATPKVAKEYLAARKFEAQGKYEQAREIYQAMLDKHPENPDYQHRLAVVCTRLQRYGEATSLYERALQRDPHNASLLADMGYTAYLRGDRIEAERLLREAVQWKPSDKRAISNLALVLGSQGKMDECRDLLQQTGDEAHALTGLAYVHSQRGELELAEERYREALKLDPNLKEATQALAELAKDPRHRELTVAKATAASQNPFSSADNASFVTETAEIQQVRSTEAVPKSMVTTANFFEESKSEEPKRTASAAQEPARLDEKIEFTGRVTLSNESKLDGEDEASDSEVEPSALPDDEPADQSSDEDDWASEPSNDDSFKRSAPSFPDDFETTTDDETTSPIRSAAWQEPASDALTFRATTPRSPRIATRKVNVIDTDFAAPTWAADPAE